jgi:NADPH-dependent glutamate synthase beta subunit-like oxidoreductase
VTAPVGANRLPLLEAMLRRPRQSEGAAPCQTSCPAGGDARAWIQVLAQRRALGLTVDQARERAWRILAAVNPLPATTGRICPHPCEAGCNRAGKDGAVAVHELERHLGDWAIGRELPLPRLDGGPRAESVAVVGAGPAGLSFAYQLARRGYRVTVHERDGQAGGMLLRGVPEHRLPGDVLAAEVARIADLGVDFRLGSGVGRDVPLAALRDAHDAVFLGIGAQVGRTLGVPGENGPGCLTGIGYLRLVNEGVPPDLGPRVIVVGGGNTAVDAARSARRAGAEVALVYRRSRAEMPAIAAEVEDAAEEGVELLTLAAPVAVLRRRGRVRALRVVAVRLGAPDESGRRRPEPVAGSERDLSATAVIAAASQEPDWSGLDDVHAGGGWMAADARGVAGDGVWAGGDVLGLGVASLAIGQGRLAAEAVHARLRGQPVAEAVRRPAIGPADVRLSLYDGRRRIEPHRRAPARRLADPDAEVTETIDEDALLAEADRCLSCGSCFGCQRCWMYCSPRGFTRLAEAAPGAYHALDLRRCEGCGKCIEVCPCGFLSVR